NRQQPQAIFRVANQPRYRQGQQQNRQHYIVKRIIIEWVSPGRERQILHPFRPISEVSNIVFGKQLEDKKDRNGNYNKSMASGVQRNPAERGRDQGSNQANQREVQEGLIVRRNGEKQQRSILAPDVPTLVDICQRVGPHAKERRVPQGNIAGIS